jgi:hypothetical protein
VQYRGNISEYYAAGGRLAEQVNADRTAGLVQDVRECTGVRCSVMTAQELVAGEIADEAFFEQRGRP